MFLLAMAFASSPDCSIKVEAHWDAATQSVDVRLGAHEHGIYLCADDYFLMVDTDARIGPPIELIPLPPASKLEIDRANPRDLPWHRTVPIQLSPNAARPTITVLVVNAARNREMAHRDVFPREIPAAVGGVDSIISLKPGEVLTHEPTPVPFVIEFHPPVAPANSPP